MTFVGIVRGGDGVLRLVEQHVALLLDAELLPAEVDDVIGTHLGAQLGDDLSVHGDHARGDQFIGLAAAADAGVRQVLVQADQSLVVGVRQAETVAAFATAEGATAQWITVLEGAFIAALTAPRLGGGFPAGAGRRRLRATRSAGGRAGGAAFLTAFIGRLARTTWALVERLSSLNGLRGPRGRSLVRPSPADRPAPRVPEPLRVSSPKACADLGARHLIDLRRVCAGHAGLRQNARIRGCGRWNHPMGAPDRGRSASGPPRPRSGSRSGRSSSRRGGRSLKDLFRGVAHLRTWQWRSGGGGGRLAASGHCACSSSVG